MKKIILAFCLLFLVAGVARAVPAKPGFRTYRQSDGSTINVELRGDEHHHSLVTEDGLTIERADNGDFYYRTAVGVTAVRAHNPGNRRHDEAAFVIAQKESLSMKAQASSPAGSKVVRRASSARRKSQVPNTGVAKVPILLVEYSDKKMSNDKAAFVTHYTKGPESVHQYFVDQSNGKYDPQFDVFGIYLLSGARATYGGNDSYGNDKGVGRMVAEACDSASKAGIINWSDYDNNGDGECDVVIVVYAGVGEAQSSLSNSVWPCQWSLSDAGKYHDGPGARQYNGTTVDRFAVFNEIYGASDYSSRLDGIGTFCHEFSHCLGLPDFYETTYQYGYFGMCDWSLMDRGCYNNDGYTPIGYSAYEKSFMGWIDFIEPTPNTQYTLPIFNNRNDSVIKIVSDINPNEYYVLENRHRQGWDKYIPGDGLLISHVSFIQSRWDANNPNNGTVQLMTIFPADNILSERSEAGDLYGTKNHELTDSTSPAAQLYLTASGSPTGKAGLMGKPVTEINLNADGTVSLWYIKAEDENLGKTQPQLVDSTHITSTSFMPHWTAAQNADSYTLHIINKSKLPAYSLLMTEDLSADTTTWEKSSTGTYKETGYLRLGTTNATGYIVSKGSIDLTDFNGVSTVAVTGKTFGTGANVPMKLSLLDEANVELATQTIVLPRVVEDSTFVIVLENPSGKPARVKIGSVEKSKRIMLSKVEVYGGDAQAAFQARRKTAVETGDSLERLITGIVDTCYNVTGLQANGTFVYEVKAVYTDSTESSWSARKEITLTAGTMMGDVNEDGIVNVSDATTLVNYILGLNPTPCNLKNGDVVADDMINVSDVTGIINIILSTPNP